MTTDPSANPALEGEPAPEPDWKAKYAELEKTVAEGAQQRANLEAQYKGLQKELNKARTRGEPTSALRDEMNDLRSTISELTGFVAEKLGDEATAQQFRSKLAQSETRAQAKAVAQQTAETLAEIAETAGFEDFDTFWNDAAMAKARTAWNAGDATTTVREATKAALAHAKAAGVASPVTPSTPPPPPPKKLDAGPPTAGGPARSSTDLAAVDTSNMTTKELREHEAAIYAAVEREMGVKFKR